MLKKLNLLIILLCLTTFSFAQSDKKTSLTNNNDILVGTWKLLEFSDLDSVTNKWTYSFGEKPRGYFTYTKNGIVNINISSTIPFKISEDSTKNYYPNLDDFIWHTGFGYFGHYTVNWKDSTVTHHVEGGTIPYYIDTDQPREFRISNDTLIIGNLKTWKRVLVKISN
jgi:hypothetical protein